VADPERWYDPGQVKPRDLAIDPRCRECKTGPMFHPAHLSGPCRAKLPGGELCPHQVCGSAASALPLFSHIVSPLGPAIQATGSGGLPATM
jgi:hypothetical protein